MRPFLLLTLLLAPSFAFAAIARDNNTSSASASFSYTTGVNATLMVISALYDTGGVADDTITYNGVEATRIENNGSGSITLNVHYLANPTAGANTLTNSRSTNLVGMTVVTYTGTLTTITDALRDGATSGAFTGAVTNSAGSWCGQALYSSQTPTYSNGTQLDAVGGADKLNSADLGPVTGTCTIDGTFTSNAWRTYTFEIEAGVAVPAPVRRPSIILFGDW